MIPSCTSTKKIAYSWQYLIMFHSTNNCAVLLHIIQYLTEHSCRKSNSHRINLYCICNEILATTLKFQVICDYNFTMHFNT